MIDYAYPCMMAEKALRDLHAAMLAGEYDQALEFALIAIAETRLTHGAIKTMIEERNAERNKHHGFGKV